MAESRLIGDCLAELSAGLPASIVAELADGLDQTWRHHLDRGLGPDAAARAALAEFGEPRVIVAAFTRAGPARHAARRLLATGPAAGACWATVLITNRAWTWPVPAIARIVPGLALLVSIALLAAAASGRRYKPARRAAAAGCIGITALDATMLTAITLIVPAVVIWPVILATAASSARILYATRSLRTVLAR